MAETPESLAALLASVADGDRSAFKSLYEATHLKLFGVIVRILRRRSVAEETLQDVYLRVWNNAGAFDPSRASAITWMATIARNRAIDEARRRTPRLAVDDGELERVVDPQPSPAQAAEQSEEAARLTECLDGLDNDQAAMVRLAYLDGATREMLSSRFGLPVSTVKTQLRRSLLRLRACLEA